MNTIKFAKKLAIPLFVALAYGPSQGLAASILGDTLDNYAVLAYSGVTCLTGPCNISGNVGSFPVAATAVFNFVSGGLDNANATTAQTELVTAINTMATVMTTEGYTTLINGSLDALQTAQGVSIAPGNYYFPTIGTLTGNITLAGGANTNPVWNFWFASSLITSTDSDVSVTGTFLNNAGIYWHAGTQVTLDGTSFAGNVMAGSAITSDGTIMKIGCGRLLAQTENVTLLKDTVRIDCLGAGSGSDGFDQGNMAPVPEPETYAMLLAGLGMMGFVARRRQRNLAAAA